MLYPSYSMVYVRHALYSTARDNGDSFSHSYSQWCEMQSTINQLKHGKGRAVRTIMVLGVVSIDHTPHTIIANTALPSVL